MICFTLLKVFRSKKHQRQLEGTGLVNNGIHSCKRVLDTGSLSNGILYTSVEGYRNGIKYFTLLYKVVGDPPGVQDWYGMVYPPVEMCLEYRVKRSGMA